MKSFAYLSADASQETSITEAKKEIKQYLGQPKKILCPPDVDVCLLGLFDCVDSIG